MMPNFLFYWTIFVSITFTIAGPLIGEGDDRDDNLVTVIYNDVESSNLLVANAYPYFDTDPLPPATDIRNARIDVGPSGIRCFFSSPSALFSSSQSENPFVSETFMASDEDGLQTPFSAAYYLTCFRLPKVTAKMVAVWLESYSVSPEAPSGPHALIFIGISENDNYGFFNIPFDEYGFTINAAAIVYGTGPAPGCFLMSDREALQTSFFSAYRPRLTPLEETYRMIAVENLPLAIQNLNRNS